MLGGHSGKDKLMLHVKTCHGWVANVNNWYQDVTSDWKRQCGFCGSMFLTWEARCEHVGQHFLEGKRMKLDWKDPWRLDNKTFSQGGNDDDEDDVMTMMLVVMLVVMLVLMGTATMIFTKPNLAKTPTTAPIKIVLAQADHKRTLQIIA